MHASMAKAKPKPFMLLFKYPGLSKGSTVNTKLLTLQFQTTLMPEMQSLNFKSDFSTAATECFDCDILKVKLKY